MANQRPYEIKLGYSQNYNRQMRDYSSNPDRQNNRGKVDSQERGYFSNPDRLNNRGNFYNRERDSFSNPERQNNRGNIDNQGRDFYSNPDRQNNRGNDYSQGRDYLSNTNRQNNRGNFYNRERNSFSNSERQSNRGNFYNKERDSFSNPERQNNRGNFGIDKDYYSYPEGQIDRGNSSNQSRNYSSYPEVQNDKGDFGNQGRDCSSYPEREIDRGNYGNQSRDYSSYPEKQNDKGNFGNQGRDCSWYPERQIDRGNYGNQGRNYSSNPVRQDDRGNFDNQGRDYCSNYNKDYSINQERNTPFDKNEEDNFYKRRVYFDDTHPSESDENTTSSLSIKLNNSCDEQMVFNCDRFSQQSQYKKNTFSQASNQQRQDNNQPWNSSGQFGRVKKDTFDNNKLSNSRDRLIQAQFGSFGEEINCEREGNFEEEDNDEEVLTNTYQNWNDDEGDNSNDEDFPVKDNAFVPSTELVEKFKYFPPSAEEMGDIFKGMVIYYFYKVKNIEEKNPFVIICESFRRSDRFGGLEIEDGYNRRDKDVKYCTIRWNEIMMVRGVGYSANLKEPRVVAAVELINTLAMTCYTLKMKDSYYSLAAVKAFMEKGTDPSNTVRFVTPHEASDLKSAQEFIVNFFKDDNDCELFFTDKHYIQNLKWWTKDNGFENRFPKGLNILGVSMKRSPQYWRDKILASGKMENERFELIPPQGIGKHLLKDFDITTVIGRLRKSKFAIQGYGEKTKYAHNDAGLNIVRSYLPWEQRGRGPTPKNRNKFNKINKAIQEGQPLANMKAYKVLNKHQKKRMREKINKMKSVNMK